MNKLIKEFPEMVKVETVQIERVSVQTNGRLTRTETEKTMRRHGYLRVSGWRE